MSRYLVLLAFLTGCPLLDIQAEVDDLCITQTGISIPAAPAGVDGELTQDFTFDNLDALSKLSSVSGDVQFASATVVPSGGASSLSFVDSAHLTIAADAQPAIDAFDCDGDCFAAGDALNLSAMAEQNVLSYLTAKALSGSIALRGTLPTSDWSVDVTVCLRGNVGQSF
jgi:hypothetical protein